MGSTASIAAVIQAVPDSSLKEALQDVSEQQTSRLLVALDNLEIDRLSGDVDVAVTLLSGKELPSIRADSSWTGMQLKSAITKFIDKDSMVKELRAGEQILGDGQVLRDLGLAPNGCWKLQAVLAQRHNHILWLEFQRQSPCKQYLHRILIADDVKAASSTVKLIRQVEADYEDMECGDSSALQAGRVQFLLMSPDRRHVSSDLGEQVALIPAGESHTNIPLIVSTCQSHSVDAVIAGSGAVAGGDMQFVYCLKEKLAEAGLQTLVFGPSSSVHPPPEEPSGGWVELPTRPPAGARVSDTYCLHCQDRVEAEIGKYISCHINPEPGESGFRHGYPGASWLHCVRCGGAVEIPSPGWWDLIRFDRSFVFRSSHPEAGDATFALCDDGEGLLVQLAEQIDGEWTLTNNDDRDEEECPPKFYEETGSYLERLNALGFEDTTELGPSKQITFKLTGMRRISEEEAKEQARLDGEEWDDEDPPELRKKVDVKTGKWMGSGQGIHWDDGEIWHCLGTMKIEPEEE